MVQDTGNKGLFYWQHEGHTALLALATDDILLAATHKSLYIKFKVCLTIILHTQQMMVKLYNF